VTNTPEQQALEELKDAIQKAMDIHFSKTVEIMRKKPEGNGHGDSAGFLENWRRTNLGAKVWGFVLAVVLGYIVLSVVWILASCDAFYDPVIKDYILCNCEGMPVLLYLILRDFGTGIGAVGAGVGLAWAAFYKK